MAFKLTIPARINILGNPSDANEGDFATISSAVNIYAYATIEKADKIFFEQRETTENGLEITLREEYNLEELPLPYTGTVDLAKGGVNRLWGFSPGFRQKLASQGFRLTLWTEVPRQSGLGGSSLFVLLTLGGLRALYGLDPILHNDYVLAELAQRVEAKELNIHCGFADRYVPLLGGIAYLNYHGKLHQKTLHEEPYVTYERLDPWISEDFPLVAVCSGVEHDSGDVHGQMRPRYIEEYDAWVAQGGDIPPMVQFMSTAYETAWRGKIALLQRDWETFGALMNQNHQVVDEMMTYCGFADGAGWANNLLVEAALANGALGAKLTGAGSGGSVFAITHPGAESHITRVWEKTITEAGLEKARIYQLRITHQGLVIEPIPKGN
jgi:galactokinase/mevalonate kinase-like predicted kinase